MLILHGLIFLGLSQGFTGLSIPSLFSRRSIAARDVHLLESKGKVESFSLGAPTSKPRDGSFLSSSNIEVHYKVEDVLQPEVEVSSLIDTIDTSHGVLLTSSYEYPGRYTRWTVGFTAPALMLSGRGNQFKVQALNERGKILQEMILDRIKPVDDAFMVTSLQGDSFSGEILRSEKYFPEEERSKQPSLFSVVRTISAIFQSEDAGQLGLYGAFGYDLAFQFEKIVFKKPRDNDQQDLILYLPDEILVLDNVKKDAWKIKYDFIDRKSQRTTFGLARTVKPDPYQPQLDSQKDSFKARDNQQGDYAQSVVQAKEQFKVGNLFEVVLSQIFRAPVVKDKPSDIFRRLTRRNPSPYGFFMNLGANEFLVGASPEMFVRVENTRKGLRVETCPISGTIERGTDPLEDAQQIKKLLANTKEESELTMCTDVDRNDKSRVCVPGSVQVLGRRQIEIYSRLIHTVDHVEGYLRRGFDALDAFLCHTWAVTVTGAPKTWALRFIEDSEASPRLWYGGAVGMVGFDGSLNTGLTLRTIRIHDGVAEVRAGATLLHDSVPLAEEAETELKASALIDAILRPESEKELLSAQSSFVSPTFLDISAQETQSKRKVLLVDHEDSFVHTLANYLRQTGAEVVTCRSGSALKNFIAQEVDSGHFEPDLVVLSPGPGNPSDFHLKETIATSMERHWPLFGVCLGLQGLVEYFGGDLQVLDYPMHGKPSVIARTSSASASSAAVDGNQSENRDILMGLPDHFQVARYHSLYGRKATFPYDVLDVTAETDDGVIMAIQHKTLPIAAVQFHPESILTLPKHGLQIVENALTLLTRDAYQTSP